jgi:hypothetical protein
MNMLRHDHIRVNVESVVTPHPLQGSLKDSPAGVRRKQSAPMVATESDEMTLPTVMKTR